LCVALSTRIKRTEYCFQDVAAPHPPPTPTPHFPPFVSVSVMPAYLQVIVSHYLFNLPKMMSDFACVRQINLSVRVIFDMSQPSRTASDLDAMAIDRTIVIAM